MVSCMRAAPRWKTRLAVLAGALVFGAPFGQFSAVARAATKQSAKLVYVRGEGADTCPDEPAVRASVAVRLGYDPFALKPDEEPRRTIVVAVVRDAKGFHARIEVRDATSAVKGTRKLDSKASECGELASAITFAITIAIDPLASGGAIDEGPLPLPPIDESTDPNGGAGVTEGTSATEGGAIAGSTTTSSDASGTGTTDVDVPPPSDATEDAQATHLLASAGVVSSLGYEPGLGVGATVGAALRFPRFSIGLEGRADLPGEKVLGTGGGVRSSVLLVSLLPCVHRGIALVCALGSIGSLRSTGLGGDGRTDASLFAAAGARLGAEVPFSDSVRGRFVLDLAATLSGARLRYGDPPTEVWSSPLFSGALGAAILGVF
jgi:hypothetical protein